ncbi:hypothetical protein [Rhodoferax sp.]|uniref:hypothetical protein n=1 Tax=Rhodoferax sp. TaxID=50421 RepID=UPI0025D19A6E|nr:hypothetical protein [Rhodoferax sp.]
MSYASNAIPHQQPRQGDGASATSAADAPLSANAQAWRRWAFAGYRRTADIVRTAQPDTTSTDEAPGLSDNAHQSGFQSL